MNKRKVLNSLVDALPKKVKRHIRLELERKKFWDNFRLLSEVVRPITTVYDIGAHDGMWSASLRKYLPESNYILFEANITHKTKIEKLGFNMINVVLSDAVKGLNFYASGYMGDSYYLENTIYYKDVLPVCVQSSTLDIQIKSKELMLPDLIKIDTQGSELDILRGGKDAIDHAAAIYTEVPVQQYNINAPSIVEYLCFFDENGFAPFCIPEQHIVESGLVQVDILFLRKEFLSEYRSAWQAR